MHVCIIVPHMLMRVHDYTDKDSEWYVPSHAFMGDGHIYMPDLGDCLMYTITIISSNFIM